MPRTSRRAELVALEVPNGVLPTNSLVIPVRVLVGLALTEQIHTLVQPTLSRVTETASGVQSRIAAEQYFYPERAVAGFTAMCARLTKHLQTEFAAEGEA